MTDPRDTADAELRRAARSWRALGMTAAAAGAVLIAFVAFRHSGLSVTLVLAAICSFSVAGLAAIRARRLSAFVGSANGLDRLLEDSRYLLLVVVLTSVAGILIIIGLLG